jgi:hypothetical protein
MTAGNSRIATQRVRGREREVKERERGRKRRRSNDELIEMISRVRQKSLTLSWST